MDVEKNIMSPREVMKRCIHFKNPPRVGMCFERFCRNDTVNVCDFFVKDENGTDPWGITFEEHPDYPSIGIPKKYPAKDLKNIDQLHTPDPQLFVDRAKEKLKKLTIEEQQKYRFIATSSGIWERVQYFRGMENIFEDLLLRPETAHRLIKMCTDFWVDFVEKLTPLKGEVDALYMFDDWGTQQDTMISPEMWREFFADGYKRIIDAVHANDMDFWLHSCGRVTNLIDDFIEVGVDLLNPFQSGTCGYEEVAEKYAGKIAFMTSVDSQSTLTHGTAAQVLAECKRLDKWRTSHGGLIVGSYSYDIPEDNERVVFDYFRNIECSKS